MATDLLYLHDAYLWTFHARVVALEDDHVVLAAALLIEVLEATGG